MTIKNRLNKLLKKAGLDRCPCQEQGGRVVVHFPDTPSPDPEPCPKCGRYPLVIKVTYQESPPPAWFAEMHPGLTGDELKARWGEYVTTRLHGSMGEQAASPPDAPDPGDADPLPFSP